MFNDPRSRKSSSYTQFLEPNSAKVSEPVAMNGQVETMTWSMP